MEESDLEMVLGWRNHPEVRRYMYTTHEISLSEHSAWFESARQDSNVNLLIFEKLGTPTGFVNITLGRSEPVADWGFYLAPDAPRGSGRELGKHAITFAFDILGLHKLCGQALSFNERSIRFHGTLGFVEEGRLRDQHFDGKRYHDVVCFGLLDSEWKQQNKVS